MGVVFGESVLGAEEGVPSVFFPVPCTSAAGTCVLGLAIPKPDSSAAAQNNLYSAPAECGEDGGV